MVSKYYKHDGRPSGSPADYLTVVSDRIAKAFNRSEDAQVIVLDISKAFDRVWHAGLLHKLNFRLDIWPYFVFFQ